VLSITDVLTEFFTQILVYSTHNTSVL